MKNKIVATFWFVLLVIAGVEALHFLPVLNVGGKPLRKVDLLADIRKDEVVEIEVADSDTVVLPVVKPLFVDTCNEGMTCIEDYADSPEGGGMKAFYEALLTQDKLNRPLVSTSANISGQPTPATFSEISGEIVRGVDWVADLSCEGKPTRKASSIIRVEVDGEVTVLRA